MEKREIVELDVNDLDYRKVNDWLKECERKGIKHVILHNVRGQRYIGTRLSGAMRIDVEGTAGNNLGAFMDGSTINIYGNAQDGVGNTMNAGRITVHGQAGDVVAYSMRKGEIFIQGDVGYRTGVHMKGSSVDSPLLVIGGTAEDFLGEYMAGGTIIVLGLESRRKPSVGAYLGTGMHGGRIYIRGKVKPHKLGKEPNFQPMTEEDWTYLRSALSPFCAEFAFELEDVLKEEFVKLVPASTRPYGRLYVGAVGTL